MSRKSYIQQMTDVTGCPPSINTKLTADNTKNNVKNDNKCNKATMFAKKLIGLSYTRAEQEVIVHNLTHKGERYHLHISKYGNNWYPTTKIFTTSRIKVDLDKNKIITAVSVG